LQERDQDLIAFLVAREDTADMIARFSLQSTDPQGNAIRHGTTTNRQQIVW
jgi:hypothetical protein